MIKFSGMKITKSVLKIVCKLIICIICIFVMIFTYNVFIGNTHTLIDKWWNTSLWTILNPFVGLIFCLTIMLFTAISVLTDIFDMVIMLILSISEKSEHPLQMVVNLTKSNEKL